MSHPGPIPEAGKRYGMLAVLDAHRSTGGKTEWLCECDCKARKWIRAQRLRTKKQISCGCSRADPATRQAARWMIPPHRRRRIARIAADASKARRAAP